MIETYLSERPTLKAVVMIMDIRRTPDEKDLYLIGWLGHHQIPAIPILTKTDKLKTSQQARQLTLVSATTGIPMDRIILFSAKTRTGKERIWEAIERTCHAAAL